MLWVWLGLTLQCCCEEAKLSANDSSIWFIPVIVADCSPGIIPTDLHPSLVWCQSTTQTHFSISTQCWSNHTYNSSHGHSALWVNPSRLRPAFQCCSRKMRSPRLEANPLVEMFVIVVTNIWCFSSPRIWWYSNFSFVRKDITIFDIIMVVLIGTEKGWTKCAKDTLSKHHHNPQFLMSVHLTRKALWFVIIFDKSLPP